jgi:hypothetical protein
MGKQTGPPVHVQHNETFRTLEDDLFEALAASPPLRQSTVPENVHDQVCVGTGV